MKIFPYPASIIQAKDIAEALVLDFMRKFTWRAMMFVKLLHDIMSEKQVWKNEHHKYKLKAIFTALNSMHIMN